MSKKKSGVITHYYDRLEVATAKIDEGKLKVGDKIKVFDREGSELFEQEVTSLQIDGKNVSEVGKGDDFGMNVDQKVKEGYMIEKTE